MGKLVGALVAIFAGLALATAATFTVTGTAGPDNAVNLENPPAANGSDGTVDYGTP